MRCSHCGNDDTKVLDTRHNDQGVRRRRECKRCGARFSTMERILATSMSVLKRNGRTEEFSREKLAAALRTAAIKRPFRAGTIEKLVDEIEDELQKQGRAEVSTRTIGELAMEKLSKTDRVAYIRFASVYRDFTDEQDFRETIEAPGRWFLTGLNQPTLADSAGAIRRKAEGTPPQKMSDGRRTPSAPPPAHTDLTQIELQYKTNNR